jgi:hypothetical protein
MGRGHRKNRRTLLRALDHHLDIDEKALHHTEALLRIGDTAIKIDCGGSED